MKQPSDMTLSELEHEQQLQPKVQVFQLVVGFVCFCVAVLFLIIFNVWASIGLFFAAICQVALWAWRRGYIEQIDDELATRSADTAL